MVIFIIMNISNINEKSILLKIHKTTTKMITLLQEIKHNKLEIQKDINNLDNNYFVEKTFTMERFNEIFDNNALNDLSSVLEIFCENINQEMDIICLDHEYVSDHIDIGIDKVKKIWYCNKCHASKKSE